MNRCLRYFALIQNVKICILYRRRISGPRSEDELSIGPGGDDDYQDELVQEAADASQEIMQKTSKPRYLGLHTTQ